jgi:hypothetical protein
MQYKPCDWLAGYVIGQMKNIQAKKEIKKSSCLLAVFGALWLYCSSNFLIRCHRRLMGGCITTLMLMGKNGSKSLPEGKKMDKQHN